MSSKAAKRREAYQRREEKRQQEKVRQDAIRNARDMESLARVLNIPLK